MEENEIKYKYPEEPAENISVLKKRKEHTSQQLQTFRFVWWGWLIASGLGGIFIYTILVATKKNQVEASVLTTKIVLGCFLGLFLYAYFVGSFRLMLSNRLRRLEVDLIKAGAIELQESIDQNFFTKLVQINFKYIDQYYLQTQEQADKSFRLSSFAAISGFIIILFGIFMMYIGKTQAAYVTTSSGLLGEFISSIFFYLYNKTILKMSQYHQKLVLTQNISLALKITDEMDKQQKDKALELLIDRLTIDVNKHLTETKN